MNAIALQTKKKSKFTKELNAVFTIMMRDITLFFKSPGTIIMSLAMPVIMMGMLGGTLMQNMASGLGYNYGQFMLVGMLVNMLFMTTSMGMSSLVEDHTTDFTQEMMISPVSRYSIITGKILGSSFGAIIGMTGTIIMGLIMGIYLSVGQYLLILALSPLICLAAGAFSMVFIGFIKSTKLANMVLTMLTMLQMFLAGAIIPVSSSSGILMVLNRMMPMTYCLDLVRAVVYAGTPEYASVLFEPWVSITVIAAIAVIGLVIGTFFFARSEKKK